MAREGGGLLPLLRQGGRPEGADGIEQAEAVGRARIPRHHRLLQQTLYAVDHLPWAILRLAADGRRRLEREAVAKHREPPEEPLLSRLEEVVAPGDQVVEGPLPQRRRAIDGGKLEEPLAQHGGDPRRAEEGDAGGSQLEREGDPLGLPADCDHRLGVRLVEPEAPVGLAGALEEQGDRLHGGQLVDGAGRPVGRLRERFDLEDALAPKAQLLPRGGKHAHASALLQQTLRERGDVSDHMLAVVEHEQGLVLSQVVDRRGEGIGGLQDGEPKRPPEGMVDGQAARRE